jgi:hypothetical protein
MRKLVSSFFMGLCHCLVYSLLKADLRELVADFSRRDVGVYPAVVIVRCQFFSKNFCFSMPVIDTDTYLL